MSLLTRVHPKTDREDRGLRWTMEVGAWAPTGGGRRAAGGGKSIDDTGGGKSAGDHVLSLLHLPC
ncbi:MAG: hypothetical protein K0U66_09710 [Gammaproteobacteria bacterium]|nr:hypothetical protein [Gammaproteobacteria bacterium]